MLEEFGSWVFKFLIILVIGQFIFHLTLEVAILFFKDYLDLKRPNLNEWKKVNSKKGVF